MVSMEHGSAYRTGPWPRDRHNVPPHTMCLTMANVHIICGIEGCEVSWDVKPAAMKKTLEQHRRVAHPGWTPPEKKLGEPYRLDYGGRARQF